MKKGTYILAGILALSVFLHIYGIGWGVSDKNRVNLLIGEDNTIDKYIPVMENLHKEIDEMVPSYGHQYSPSYLPDELTTVKIGDKETTAPKSVFNSLRSYLVRSYGPDEQRAIIALSRINPDTKDFNPRFYAYGGVYLYPMGLFFYGLSRLNLLTLKDDMSYYFHRPEKIGKIFVSGRFFGAVGALLSVFVFYLLCSELLTDKKTIYFLTLFYAISPGFVLWSHYLKPFSYGMLWFLLSLWTAVKFYRSEKTEWLYTSAVFAGLSFGTLLSYGYIYWAVLIFVLFSGKRYKWKLKTLFLSFLVFLATFVVTNPYILLSWKEFMLQMKSLHNYWHRDMSVNALKIFVFNTLRYGMGTLLWIVALVGTIGSLVYKTEKRNWMFFLLLLPGFLYFAFTTAEWVHYSIFLYPLFIISSGFFLSKIGLKKVVTVFLSIVGIYTILYSGSYVKISGEKNTRTTAGEWINSSISFGSKVGLLEAPSPWRTPPFRFLDYELVITLEESAIEREKPEYFITSEYQWLRGAGLPAMKEFLFDYEIIKRFEKVPSIMGIKFRSEEEIPYDWCNPNPMILIWKRKK